MTRIAIVAPGAMGSAVAARLTEHGATVVTSLDGRSTATVERAQVAGMTHADDARLASADLFLSILPPADSVALAERFTSVLAKAERKAVFVDCNAVNVETKRKIAAVIAPSGAAFVDAAIIGLPPKPGTKGPRLYLSGDDIATALCLRDLGLDARLCEGGVGAASALKMAYAGLNKGLTALAATMVAAATRTGAIDAFRAELAETEPALLARFERGLPDMVPKAYRWVAEMREIATFLGDDEAGRLIFQGIERLYKTIASDQDGELVSDLRAFAEGTSRNG